MTPEEAAFQARLDADPSDSVTRLIFADWLEEQDPPDPRAAGYRALGVGQHYPQVFDRGTPYEAWWYWSTYENEPWDLSDSVWWHIYRGEFMTNMHAPYSRQFSEDAAALAFARLPADRRAALLAPTPTEARA